jgi:diketogulonate reductase-like aldo/keto reductase
MEVVHESGRARLLGVSNVTLEQFHLLCQRARVRPRFVQNRCHAARAGTASSASSAPPTEQ